ncbi:hypothetical protein T484DRAFT_1893865, partial [Baffinella frigidus]
MAAGRVGNLLALDPLLEIGEKDVGVSLLPWSQPAGFICELLRTARAGASVACSEGRSRLRANLEEVRPTTLMLFPEGLRYLEAQLIHDAQLHFFPWQVTYARKLARYAPTLLPPAPQPRGGPLSPAALPSGDIAGPSVPSGEKSVPSGEKASSLPSGEKAPMWARVLLWVVNKYIFRKMRRMVGGRLKRVIVAGSARGVEAAGVGEAGVLGELRLKGFQGVHELYTLAEGVVGVRKG